MGLIKRKSIEQLRKEIAEQKRRISKERLFSAKISERQKLRRQLFELRNRKLLEAGEKTKRLSKRFGRGLLTIGKKAAPILQKQARLIREQQLRDEAIKERLDKPLKKKSKKKSRKKPKKKVKRKKRR